MLWLRLLIAGLLVALAAVLPGSTAAPVGMDFDAYARQVIRWEPCGEGQEPFECTRVLAPLDWARPEGEALTLFALRRPATRQPRLGTLFVNPGGPGEPGSRLPLSFRHEGLEQFDIVGWDPRGTGRSTAVRCADPPLVDAFFELDVSPDDAAERTALIEANRAFGQSCLRGSGQLLRHISTLDTVADLELLRTLTGEEKLNFFGYSYGTDIGSRYAHTHPGRVGRIVLDGAVNVTDSRDVTQAMGFDRALTRFADWCVRQGCSLGADSAAVLASVTRFLDELDTRPLPVDKRLLTQSQAVTGVLLPLYGSDADWRLLVWAVEAAQRGEGRMLLALADLYNARSPDGAYGSRLLAFTAIRCRDKADEGLAEAESEAAEQIVKAPTIGPYIGVDYACATWPVPPIAKPEPVTARGAAPILVIGTTGDSATPYEFAVRMAAQLESGVLLTYEGPGHGAYGGNSRCVDDAVVAYLTGAGPAADIICQ